MAVDRLRRGLEALRDRRTDAASARRNRHRADRCFYCGVAFGDGPSTRTVDHRLARGRGGRDGLVNLVFACQACNTRKADQSEEAFSSSTWLAERRRDIEALRCGPDGTTMR